MNLFVQSRTSGARWPWPLTSWCASVAYLQNSLYCSSRTSCNILILPLSKWYFNTSPTTIKGSCKTIEAFPLKSAAVFGMCFSLVQQQHAHFWMGWSFLHDCTETTHLDFMLRCNGEQPVIFQNITFFRLRLKINSRFFYSFSVTWYQMTQKTSTSQWSGTASLAH